ncbi:MAG: hypothetical protein JW708_10335 [Vallitaleaceae bacterium]|nr:hypothetical protein [Vallitaleaceae bacterium]
MEYVHFHNQAFELAVRAGLKIRKKSKLTIQDINKVNGIMICDMDPLLRSISCPWSSDSDCRNVIFPEVWFNVNSSDDNSWVEDLLHFDLIRSLFVFTQIQDFSFINKMKRLQELQIRDCIPKAWTFIEELVSLRKLAIFNSNFSDLNPLVKLYEKQVVNRKEESVKLDKNQYKSLSYAYLGKLCLVDCNIEDINPLSKLKELRELNLSHNQIFDLRPLAEVEWLYYVILRYNQIEDISPLQNLRRIYLLNLRHNKIRDISALSAFHDTHIGRLYLGYNKITDYSILSNIFLVHSDLEELVERSQSFTGDNHLEKRGDSI